MGNLGSKQEVPDRQTCEALIRKGKNRSERTVTLTVENLMRLRAQHVNLADVPGTVASLNAKMKRSTAATYLCAIVNLLAATTHEPKTAHAKLLAAYRKEMRKALKETEDFKQENPLTHGQEKGWMDWDDIVAKRDAVDKTSPEYLAACLYTLIPPLRDDFGEMKITHAPRNNARSSNWVYIGEGDQATLVLNKYKTGKTYGQKLIPLPENLAAIIKRCAGKVYLFENADGSAVGKGRVPDLLRKALQNQYMGPALMRKIVKTEMSKRGIGGAQRLASAMCHSISMAEDHYNQNAQSLIDNSMGITVL
jgi:hypothetical protein